jgi:hypothetical protein
MRWRRGRGRGVHDDLRRTCAAHYDHAGRRPAADDDATLPFNDDSTYESDQPPHHFTCANDALYTDVPYTDASHNK